MSKRIKNDLERSLSNTHSRHSKYGKIIKIIEGLINPEEVKIIQKNRNKPNRFEEIDEDSQLLKYKITQLSLLPKENRYKIYGLIADFLEKSYIKISRSFSTSSLLAKEAINRLKNTYVKKPNSLSWLKLKTNKKYLLDKMRKYLLEHIEEAFLISTQI